jgi:hypothetical protein
MKDWYYFLVKDLIELLVKPAGPEIFFVGRFKLLFEDLDFY